MSRGREGAEPMNDPRPELQRREFASVTIPEILCQTNARSFVFQRSDHRRVAARGRGVIQSYPEVPPSNCAQSVSRLRRGCLKTPAWERTCQDTPRCFKTVHSGDAEFAVETGRDSVAPVEPPYQDCSKTLRLVQTARLGEIWVSSGCRPDIDEPVSRLRLDEI